jgi:hypothetical protein
MEAGTIAAGASALQGVVGYKGNKQAARYARQVAERDAELARNESLLLARAKRDEEAQARRRGEATKGSARVAIAASGVQFTGTPLVALSEMYFDIEETAKRIQYASSIEQAAKEAEVTSILLSGEARRTGYQQAAVGSLISGTTQAATTYQEFNG